MQKPASLYTLLTKMRGTLHFQPAGKWGLKRSYMERSLGIFGGVEMGSWLRDGGVGEGESGIKEDVAICHHFKYVALLNQKM